MVEVFYVDYGNSSQVSKSDIRLMKYDNYSMITSLSLVSLVGWKIWNGNDIEQPYLYFVIKLIRRILTNPCLLLKATYLSSKQVLSSFPLIVKANSQAHSECF